MKTPFSDSNLVCPWCSNLSISLRELISSINGRTYWEFSCPQCALVYFAPRQFEQVYENEKLEVYAQLHAGRDYTEWSSEMVRVLRKLGVNLLDRTILEIGVGDGVNFDRLRDAFGIRPTDYYGVEQDAKSVEVCRRKGLINVHQAMFDETSGSIFPGKFDVIIITEVLEHQTAPRLFLKNAFDLLKDGGICVVSVPNYERWFRKAREIGNDIPPHHFLRFRKVFFRRNFHCFYVGSYPYRYKKPLIGAQAASVYLFNTPLFWPCMLLPWFILYVSDWLNGEGLIAVLGGVRSGLDEQG